MHPTRWSLGVLVLPLVVVGCPRAPEPSGQHPTATITAAAAPTDLAARASASPASPAGKGSPCILKLETSRHQSVLEEQRQTGPPADDFQRVFAAEPIDAATYSPVKVVARFTLGGAPLLWFTPDRRRAVLNAKAFGDLQMIDAPRLDAGETKTIGKMTPTGAAQLDGRAVLEFLIGAEIIQTYWHIGAELCLRTEDQGPAGYRAEIDGVHIYYTNEENRDPVRFQFMLSPDGTLTITGR